MAKIDELYLTSQEKERAAEVKTITQNRDIYGGYMQEIDPYGEFAERIAKKGLSKSGYPQYDYEGFKKAFEARAGDNMQNLRQLKAEIQAALNLALATQNEKLEETLLDYQEKLAKLEQEYFGKATNSVDNFTAAQNRIASPQMMTLARTMPSTLHDNCNSMHGFLSVPTLSFLLINPKHTAPPRGYDGMCSVEGGRGKSFIYDPVEKTIEVFRTYANRDIMVE